MSKLTLEQKESAIRIIDWHFARTEDMGRWESLRFTYNNAINDAAEFLNDLIPYNPSKASALIAASNEIKKWLLIPEREEN